MKYCFVVIFFTSLSLISHAGFLDKVSKAASVVDQGLKVVSPDSKTASQTQQASEQSVGAEQPSVVQQKVKALAPSSDAKSLEVPRSGKVAYAPNNIQWGDSKEVLEKTCGLHNADYTHSGLNGDRSQMSFIDDMRSIRLWLYPKVGVYQITIRFLDDNITYDMLVEKYTSEYGEPKIDILKEKGPFGGMIETGRTYQWDAGSHKIVISTGRAGGMSVELLLINHELVQKVQIEEGKREARVQREKEEKTKALLDF